MFQIMLALAILAGTTGARIERKAYDMNAAGTLAAMTEEIQEAAATPTEEPTTEEPQQPEIMQDLNQCVVVNGVLLCIDICGGRSEPGTICSYE